MVTTRPIAYKFDADINRFMSETAKTQARQEAMIAKLKEMNRAGKKTKSGLEKLASSATAQFISVASVIAAATKALTAFDKASTQAQASFDAAFEGRKAFGQISQTPEELSFNIDTSKLLREKLGLSASVAENTAFIGASQGLSREQILDISRSDIINVPPAQLLSAIESITNQFGAKEAGTPKQITNKLLAATSITKEEVGPFSEVAASLGSTFGLIGATDEETFAALAVAAKGGNVKEQRTRLRAFAGELGKKDELRGKTFSESKGFLKSNFGSGENIDKLGLQDFFGGNKEALEGAAFYLRNLDLVNQTEQDIIKAEQTTGTDSSVFNTRVRNNLAEPGIRAKIERNKAVQVNELAGEDLATDENLQDAAIAIGDAVGNLALSRGKISGIFKAASDFSLGFADKFGSVQETIDLVRKNARQANLLQNVDIKDEVLALLKPLEEIEKLNRDNLEDRRKKLRVDPDQ